MGEQIGLGTSLRAAVEPIRARAACEPCIVATTERAAFHEHLHAGGLSSRGLSEPDTFAPVAFGEHLKKINLDARLAESYTTSGRYARERWSIPEAPAEGRRELAASSAELPTRSPPPVYPQLPIHPVVAPVQQVRTVYRLTALAAHGSVIDLTA